MIDYGWEVHIICKRGEIRGLLSLGERGDDKEGYFLDISRSCFYFLFSVAAWTADEILKE